MTLFLDTTEVRLPNAVDSHSRIPSLILGWPEQTDHRWFTALDHLSSYPSTHVPYATCSAYLLSVLGRLRTECKHGHWTWTYRPSDDAAFNDAERFVDRLPALMEWMPDVGLADDGEVNFLWASGAGQIDLGFYGTGTYSYFARDQFGHEFFGDDVPVVNDLPNPIRKLVSP